MEVGLVELKMVNIPKMKWIDVLSISNYLVSIASMIVCGLTALADLYGSLC